MARFQRGDEVVSIWIERWTDPDEVHSRVWTQRNDAEPVVEAEHVGMVIDRVYRAHQKDYVVAGWRRVVDPGRERVYPALPAHPAFDHTLWKADELDDVTLSVYADWLIEQGHPRGGEIANALAAPHPGVPAELGVLGEYRHPYPVRLRVDHWHRAFLLGAWLDGGYGGDLGEHALWELLRHPAARLLQGLTLKLEPWDDSDLRLATGLLVTSSAPPPLRRLEIRQGKDLRYRLGDLSALSVQYPLLEDLELHLHPDDVLGTFDLPKCRRLRLTGRLLTHAHLAAILSARWPALEELELDLPSLTAPREDLELLETTLAPQLKRYVIRP